VPVLGQALECVIPITFLSQALLHERLEGIIILLVSFSPLLLPIIVTIAPKVEFFAN
jgi:hypothetical protein